MIIHVFAFSCGTLLLHFQSELPPVALLCLASLPIVLCWRVRVVRPLLSLLIGLLWGTIDAQNRLQQRLPESLYQQDLEVSGLVVGLPQRNDRRQLLLLRIDAVEQQPELSLPLLARLSWYDLRVRPAAGERWHLRVRLKPPRGFKNPAGFDYEGWLFRQGIGAVGYVRDNPRNRRGSEPTSLFSLHKLRERIGETITRQLGSGRSAATMRALTIGDRSGFTNDDWALFRKSGTNHLVAISGLHIGIAGGLSFWLCGWLWRRFPALCLRFPAPMAAAVGAIGGALCYAALAGFSIPTQRALVMLTIAMTGLLLRSGIRPTHTLSVALIAILLLDPTAPLSAGFWLSFAAVAVILLAVSNRTGQRSRTGMLMRIQYLIAFGLAPLLLIWEQPVPAVAPLVNLLAVPLYSLAIVPLALLATLVTLFSPAIGAPLMDLAASLVELSLKSMELAVVFSWQLAPPIMPPAGLWLSLILGITLLMLPRGIPARWLGSLLLLPLLLVPGSVKPLPNGAVQLTALDVGQGMALVVRTATHTLVYDSGPRYSAQFDAGSGIVAPFLRQMGITSIDLVILSNGDADHSGGIEGLSDQLSIVALIGGEPARSLRHEVDLCQSGASWNWDGVHFQLLHPNRAQRQWQGNNASCVLLVTSAAGRILITGDIESRAERRLLDCCRQQLAADIVTVPHHGSATSSTQAFVSAVDADYALVSSGFLNRYGFPKPAVAKRWLTQGAELHNTATSGAIQFYLSPAAGVLGPDRYRLSGRRYWNFPAR